MPTFYSKCKSPVGRGRCLNLETEGAENSQFFCDETSLSYLFELKEFFGRVVFAEVNKEAQEHCGLEKPRGFFQQHIPKFCRHFFEPLQFGSAEAIEPVFVPKQVIKSQWAKELTALRWFAGRVLTCEDLAGPIPQGNPAKGRMRVRMTLEKIRVFSRLLLLSLLQDSASRLQRGDA